MGQFSQFYGFPLFYDIIFERDVGNEVDFILAVHERYAGRTLDSILEIGCGPAYHARAFARRGQRAIGLDISPQMLDFAASKAAAEKLELEWLCTDMRDFRLPKPVDMAISVNDSHDALLTTEDLVQHFQSVANSLRDGGLYLFSTSHPSELNLGYYPVYRYKGERDGLWVELVYGANQPQIDPVNATALVELELTVAENGKTAVLRDQAYERILSPQEIALLAKLSNVFQVIAWYGAFHISQPLDNSPGSKEVIAILRKSKT